MAKKTIAVNDLEWLALQEARASKDCPSGFALAIVGNANSWRIALQKRSIKHTKPTFLRKILEIEKRLQENYDLAD